MSDFTYRNATVADAPLLARIGADSFAETFGHLYTPENLAAEIESLLSKPVDYADVETGTAARAAQMIAELI